MTTAISVESVESEIRESMCQMKRNVPHGNLSAVPEGYRRFLRDLCRSAPRTKRPMGQYPEVGVALGVV
jgi:hypothetical protein